jgi:hypothetical protein
MDIDINCIMGLFLFLVSILVLSNIFVTQKIYTKVHEDTISSINQLLNEQKNEISNIKKSIEESRYEHQNKTFDSLHKSIDSFNKNSELLYKSIEKYNSQDIISLSQEPYTKDKESLNNIREKEDSYFDPNTIVKEYKDLKVGSYDFDTIKNSIQRLFAEKLDFYPINNSRGRLEAVAIKDSIDKTKYYIVPRKRASVKSNELYSFYYEINHNSDTIIDLEEIATAKRDENNYFKVLSKGRVTT